jgi:hypothetical protein
VNWAEQSSLQRSDAHNDKPLPPLPPRVSSDQNQSCTLESGIAKVEPPTTPAPTHRKWPVPGLGRWRGMQRGVFPGRSL